MKPSTLKQRQIMMVLFLLFNMILSIVHVPLKKSEKTQIRSQILYKLKLAQHNYNFISFLQEVPLHVQVIAQKRLATYYGDIGVGKGVGADTQKIQTFKMLFDTGSCEFWIPSVECKTDRCLQHDRYDHSNTIKVIQDTEMSIQYLSGKVAGEMAYEDIYLGDIVVSQQVIGIAREIDIPLLDEVVWDGILGLAYPNQNLKTQEITPLFDTMMKEKVLTSKGEKNQFAYYLGADNGSITFGGADMRYKRSQEEDFVWAPIAEKNYWTVMVTDVKKQLPDEKPIPKNEGQSICKDGCKTIIDTGTYLIYGPADQVTGYLGDIMIDSCTEKAKLPNIIFELAGMNDSHGKPQVIELTLTPDDYVLQFEIDGQMDCVIGIAPDNQDTGWTLGQVFLRAFYTIFDRENEAIGFVRSNPNPNPAPGETNDTTNYN